MKEPVTLQPIIREDGLRILLVDRKGEPLIVERRVPKPIMGFRPVGDKK